jgi:DNA-binding CsgD family transcriptional regulator
VALGATGINRKRVAETLFVSEATVGNHLTSIFGKLDLSNQFELVFYAQRHSLDKPSNAGRMTTSS